MKRILALLALPALAVCTARAQTPTPTPTPVPPVFHALGFKADGTLNAPSGSISRGDPAFGGQQAASSVSGLGPLATVSPTGTPGSTTFLRGDNSWQTPPSGGAALPGTTCLLKGNGAGGALAATPGTDYASGAQGALANTALQPGGDGSALTAATGRDVSAVTYSGYSVECWGDSLTYGVGGPSSYPAQLAPLLGNRHVDNFGIGGLTAAQILAQEWQVHPDKYQGVHIIWAGRNDIGVNSNTTILSNIAAMVALIPTPQNYVVLGVINASGEPSGSANYNQITALNASLASTYGAHFLDVRSYLVSQDNPALSGDVSAHASDLIPPSLQYTDGLHLNSAGYLAVATFLANNAALWGAGQSLVTNAGVGGILYNGAQVGGPATPFVGFARSLGAGFPATVNSLAPYPTAPLHADKPVSGSNTAAKFSSPGYGAGDLTQVEFTSFGGADAGANFRTAAIGAVTGSGGGGDLVLYTAPTPTGSYADRLHVQRDGGTAFAGTDASGNVLLGTGNVQVKTGGTPGYPSTLTLESTAWDAGGEGGGLAFVGTTSGAVNGVKAGARFYGESKAWAWKTSGALATGGTVDASAQMKLDATGLTLSGVATLAPQSSTPATPASGVILYVDASGNLHALHSTGTNHVLSAP